MEKYASIKSRRMLQPRTCFLLLLYFHIHWLDKQIIVIQGRKGMIKGVAHIFSTTQSPSSGVAPGEGYGAIAPVGAC